MKTRYCTEQQNLTRLIMRSYIENSGIRQAHGDTLAGGKIEKTYGQLVYMNTFIVTTMEMKSYHVIQFYCSRGKIENFIKEGKSGFDFSSVSSAARVVNANRLQVHALVYNLFNWFRRLALPVSMRVQRIDTIRLKMLKIGAKVVKSARYKYFKLCSSCPYKKEFFETLYLHPQSEATVGITALLYLENF